MTTKTIQLEVTEEFWNIIKYCARKMHQHPTNIITMALQAGTLAILEQADPERAKSFKGEHIT